MIKMTSKKKYIKNFLFVLLFTIFSFLSCHLLMSNVKAETEEVTITAVDFSIDEATQNMTATITYSTGLTYYPKFYVLLYQNNPEIATSTDVTKTSIDSDLTQCTYYAAAWAEDGYENGTSTVTYSNWNGPNDTSLVSSNIPVGNYSIVIVLNQTTKGQFYTYYAGTIYKKNVVDNCTNTTSISNIIVKRGSDNAIVPVAPAYYMFCGYTNNNENLNDSSYYIYADGSFNSAMLSSFKASTTVYRVWKTFYNIHFDGNGATSGSMSNQSIVYYNPASKTALTSNSFSKTDYIFLGWSLDKDATVSTYHNQEEITPLTLTAGDTVTLYAIWIKKGEEITSVDMWSSEDSNQSISTQINTSYTYSSCPSFKICLFLNKSAVESYNYSNPISVYKLTNTVGDYTYYDDNNNGINYDKGETVFTWQSFITKGTSAIVASKDLPTGTYQIVLYNVDEGYCFYIGTIYRKNVVNINTSETSTQNIVKVKGSTTVQLPTTPTNCVFGSYASDALQTKTYINQNGEIVDTNKTEFLSASTVYLKWAKIYTIHFDANSGTGSMSDITHTVYFDDAKVTLSTNEFSKTYYNFLGWSKDKDAKTPTYTDGEAVLALSSSAGETVTLYAIWELKSYKIIAHMNSSKYDTVEFEFKYGEKIVFDYTSDYFKDDTHYFLKWNETLPDVMPGENIEVHASWVNNNLYVNLYYDKEMTQLYKQKKYTYLETIETSWFDNPTLSGCTFKSWNENFATVMGAESLNYYALWDKNSYVLTFELNEGEKLTYNCLYDDALPTTPSYTYHNGYLFVKWNETIPEKMPAHDVTITSSWKEAIFTLTCVLGEGLENKVYQVRYEFNIASVLETPTRDYYTFDGWEETVPEKMPLNDLTIHAKWKINTHKVLFYDVDEGKTITQNYEYGATINPPTPKKAHYTFVSWNATIPETMPDNDLEFKATWEIATYKIYFDTDGGSPIDEITFEYNQEITFNVTTTKNGFNFVSWDQEVPSKMPDHDITLKALWEERKYTVSYYVDDVLFHQDGYDYGDLITLLTLEPEKEGYDFQGWDQSLPIRMDGVDYTLKAVFKLKTYLIHFESNCSRTYADQIVNYGNKVTKVEDPERDGFAFKGWYSDSTYDTLYDFDAIVTSQLTLYAYYEQIITIESVEKVSNGLSAGIIFDKKVDKKVVLTVNITTNETLDSKTNDFLIDYTKYMDDNTIIGAVYDLNLTLDGEEVSYSGMEVQLEVPANIQDKTFILYHVTNDKDLVEVKNFEYVDGVILLKCDELKEFALCYHLDEEPADNSKLYKTLAIVGVAIAIVGITGIVIMVIHKKKLRKERNAWLDEV